MVHIRVLKKDKKIQIAGLDSALVDNDEWNWGSERGKREGL